MILKKHMNLAWVQNTMKTQFGKIRDPGGYFSRSHLMRHCTEGPELLLILRGPWSHFGAKVGFNGKTMEQIVVACLNHHRLGMYACMRMCV